jgi:hypothetical protein
MEEGIDYYFNEHGLMVFTAAYHLNRGYCCKNKCKHCPWNFGKNKEQISPKPTINQSGSNDAINERAENE